MFLPQKQKVPLKKAAQKWIYKSRFFRKRVQHTLWGLYITEI